MEWHNINVNARYEVKLLTRSGLFRTFSILAIAGISVALLMNNTSMINRWEGSWASSALTSLIPFTATYYYTIAQAVILIFLAGTFLKKGQKLDTTEVLMVRPMSNSDYILGKVLGIAEVFIAINVLILLIAAFINVFVNQTPFSLWPYIFYLLTISLPTLIFMLGLSFIAINIFKNQAVTFIILLGVVGVDIAYLTDKWYGVLDLTGCAIPAIFSDLTGMADMSSFLMQRICYLVIGVGLLLLTIAFVDRLPERKSSKQMQLYMGLVVCLLGASVGIAYVGQHNAQTKVRNKYIATFKQYAYQPVLNTVENSITVSTGQEHLDAEAIMTIVNNSETPASEITLYLNPGLEITEITELGSPLEFRRDNQVALVNRPLGGNDTAILTINYSGHIDERVCYADVVQDWIDSTKSESIQHYGKHYAYLNKKSVLLTPEAIWYPVTIAPSNPLAKYHISRDFTKYTLKVENRENREIVSQGFPIKDSLYTTFLNFYNLSGISLAIAEYEKHSITVDNIDYEIYNFKGNDFFSKHFTHISDTLPALIRDIMGDQESRFGVAYPFDKLAFVETPVHFTSYPRTWKGNTEFVQPELVFVPERAVTLNLDLEAEETRIKEWSSRSQSLPDEETMQAQLLSSFVRIITEETSRQRRNWEQQSVNMHSISPMFSNFTRYIYSYDYPIFDIALTTLQTLTANSTQARFWEGVVNNRQRANQYLESYSFQYATRDSMINPEIFYELLKLKSAQLRMYILSHITQAEYENFMDDYFFECEFRRSEAQDFVTKFKESFGVDLTPFLDNWYTAVVSPEILTSDVYASKAEFDDATQYIVEFKLYNPSTSGAIITAQIGTGGSGGGNRGGGFGGASDDNTYYYSIPAGTAWQGRILLEDQPSNLVLNYNIAKNLPTTNTFSFSKIDIETDDTTHGFVQIPVEKFSTSSKGEYIIDNESPNFRLLSSNEKNKLQELLNKESTTDKYHNMQFWRAPSKWTLTAADYMYGDVAKSAYYKRKGSGGNGAVWEFNVEDPGIYNIEIWVAANNNFGRNRRRRGAQEQYYVVSNEEWTENMALNWNRNESGWYNLGTFDLPKGVTTVTLSDKTERDYVIADAIKFVKDERKSDSGSSSNRQIYSNYE